MPVICEITNSCEFFIFQRNNVSVQWAHTASRLLKWETPTFISSGLWLHHTDLNPMTTFFVFSLTTDSTFVNVNVLVRWKLQVSWCYWTYCVDYIRIPIFFYFFYISWVRSYLSDRSQNFLVNGVLSGAVAVNCSVPQGSVLGPIMFISYMEDVSTLFQRHQIRYHLYVDDKQAYTDVPVEDVSSARRVLRDCISDVANWCSSRRL